MTAAAIGTYLTMGGFVEALTESLPLIFSTMTKPNPIKFESDTLTGRITMALRTGGNILRVSCVFTPLLSQMLGFQHPQVFIGVPAGRTYHPLFP